MDSINITTAKEYDISMQIDDVKVVNLDDYYTKAESDERFQPVGEYLTTIPEEYVTDNELDSKGYLTEHQPLKTINGESLVGPGNITIEGGGSVDLTNYYTKAESDGRFQPVGEYLTSIPEEYITDNELNSKGYLTEHQPLKTINGESLVGPGNIIIEGGGSADLTNYYTRGEVDNLVAEKARIVSLTQAEYDALDIKDENTIYNITDAEPVCYTKAESDERFLTEHQPLKTINGESIVGTGDITITGGGGGSAPGNVVTTDTTQTITGQKEFAGSVIFNGGTEFNSEIRMNNGATGDVDIAMGIACAFKVKPAQISKFYTHKIFPGNFGESDGKVHFRDFNDTTDYAVIDSTGISELGTPLSDKYQAILVSGTNIKTINGNSILGSGDITITGGGGSADLTNYYTKSEIDGMIGNISTLLAEI